MNDAEIAQRIKESKNPIEQIGIEADLNARGKRDIRAIAVNAGIFKAFDDATALKMYNAGKSDKEIGKVFGMEYFNIKDWRNKKGLCGKRNGTAKIDKPITKKPVAAIFPDKDNFTPHVPDVATPKAEPPKLPAPEHCHCCHETLPELAKGVSIIAVVRIGNISYKLCPQCAFAFTWATERLEDLGKLEANSNVS